MDVVQEGSGESIYIGGKEGVKKLTFSQGKWSPAEQEWMVQNKSFGEVRMGNLQPPLIMAGIEPMHGNILSVHTFSDTSPGSVRYVLASDLNQGHALGVSDFINSGREQVVVGWRNPNQENKMGIKLFIPQNDAYSSWNDIWIDENGMACEDLQLADLNADGKTDIIAAGRSTRNLKIYWNKSR